MEEYVNYLAYKIEAKREIREFNDKLEGLIWQDLIKIIETKDSDNLKSQFINRIKEIDDQLINNPNDFNLYSSKLSILLYYEQLDDVLQLLDQMLIKFPKNEIDLSMKKALVLRRFKDIRGGLDIIDMLIDKYPNNDELLNYRVYWLQYLNQKDKALNLIQDLIEKYPENAIYYDTRGEILMRYEEYKKAIIDLLKSIELAKDEWYIYQTYIKLGICYNTVNKELAIEYLDRGKKLIEKNEANSEEEKKWLVIANLYLSQID